MAELKNTELTPKQIVEKLDTYIIGQEKAKKAVAIALRNRFRRLKLAEDIRDEVAPKNILMIGPTGVGKTEIARRLAKLCGAPFLKVEATKYTEVGYVGRDVESMIRDLMAVGFNDVKAEMEDELREKSVSIVEEKLLDLLLPGSNEKKSKKSSTEIKPMGFLSQANENKITIDLNKVAQEMGNLDMANQQAVNQQKADEEKAELEEIVEFLKNPKKFNELGARIPKGVLLVGPPGTGKTLLGRAVAGEAGVPFLSISGSDFVEMFVGVGASRVRDLFEEAKKNSPSIIFIDEIDAVGRQRGAGLGGGNDEREQTLNQLLVEMDGFGTNEGVIVMAATNRPDVLDRALLRPGRFDRQITVNYPDVKGREEILKVHSRGKPLAPDVNLNTIAKSTAGFTGADLENLLNEAALLAARHNLKAITEEQIEEATIKVVMGTEKKSHVMSDKDKMITSYHEAGHAVVSYFLPTQDPVHQISIIPRGMAAGYTMYIPTEEKGHLSRNQILEQICSLLGGRAAEQLTQNDICSGASNDIERATELARKMITRFGMSEKLGLVTYGNNQDEVFLGRDFSSTPNYSDETAGKIDGEIADIVGAQYKKALDILNENIAKVHLVAKELFNKEKISGDDFRAIMEEND